VQYGLIPEFVGRLPVLSNVNSLSKEDLVRVLTEPKNSLLKQYEALFKLSQVSAYTHDERETLTFFFFLFGGDMTEKKKGGSSI
jgi:ATP-dependent protease Clp ATPase subunit